MAGNDHDLFRMFTAVKVGDGVVTGDVRKLLRSEGEVDAHLALSRQVGHESGVFGSDGSGGNAGGITESGVGQAEIGAADGANEGGDSTHVSCGFRSGGAVAYGLAVGDER